MSKNKLFKAGSIAVAILFFFMYVAEIDSYARAGGGRSSGSRGSRSSYSSPRSYSSPSQDFSSQNYQSQRNFSNQTLPRNRNSLLRGLGGGLLGGLAGGFIGGMLFRSLGMGGMGGAGGFAGLINILIIGLIIYAIYRFIKNRKAQRSAPAHQRTIPDINPSWQQGAQENDMSDALGQIRWADSSFSEDKFKDSCMDHFFKVQGAWANRDMSSIRLLLTDEMYRTLQKDAENLKAEKKINRLDNIAVRSVDIEETWQENGSDYITVKYLANLLDYTVDESTGSVVSGSKTEPVRFEEFWTFTRRTGSNPWQLSAIDQA